MKTGKEIITKFHSISDAELSLADTQWLIQNIDKAINSTKQAGQVEPEVMQKIADIKKEYEIFIGKQLGFDDKDDWDKVIYIDFEGLWQWIEEKLR